MTTTTNEYLVISKLTTGGTGKSNCYELTEKLELAGGNLKNPSDEIKIKNIVPGVTITAGTLPSSAVSSPLVAASSMVAPGSTAPLTVNPEDIASAIMTALKEPGVTDDATLGANLLSTYTIIDSPGGTSIDANVLGQAIRTALAEPTVTDSKKLGQQLITNLTTYTITKSSIAGVNVEIGQAIMTALKEPGVTDDATLGANLLSTYTIIDSPGGTSIDANVLGQAIRTALAEPTVTDSKKLGQQLITNLTTYTITKSSKPGGRKSRKPRGGKTKHRKYSSHSTKHNKNKNKKVRRTSKIIP